MKTWLSNLASEFVEGLADGFLILQGGTTAAAAFVSNPEQAQQLMRVLTPQQVGITMLLTGAYYVASFVKKNPPPFGQPANPKP